MVPSDTPVITMMLVNDLSENITLEENLMLGLLQEADISTKAVDMRKIWQEGEIGHIYQVIEDNVFESVDSVPAFVQSKHTPSVNET